MKILKKISLILCGLIICVGASFVLFGCGEDADYNQLYVFCSKGGYVTVEGQDGVVKNGDEGSRIFQIPDQQNIKLKAVADNGYMFSEWTYAEGINEKYETFSHQAEINLISDEEIMVVMAVFTRVGEGTFGVNYSTGEGYTINFLNGTQSVVQQGEEIKFSVALDSAYNKSNIVVKNNGTTLTAQSGIYTISNVQDDVNIEVQNVVKNKYSATIPTGTGYIIKTVAGYDANNILHGNSFKFNLEAQDGYSASDFTVSVSNGTLTQNGNLYTVSNITSDFTIQVYNGSVGVYTVSLTNTSGVSIVPKQGGFTVNAGDSFEFTITAETGFDISNIEVYYYRGEAQTSTKITPSSGVYTIENINTNIKIQINGVTSSKRAINVLDARFTIEPINTDVCFVDDGEDFVFIVKIKEGYQAPDMVVKANGVVLPASNGQYTIINVTTNQIISVEGIVAKTCTVTMPTGAGYTITKTDGSSFTSSDLTNIAYGTEFSFKLTVLDSYTGSCVVKAGSTTLTPSDGVCYTFTVKGNTQITVTGLQMRQFAVTLPSEDGVQFKSIAGTIISGTSTVNYGEEFKFKVEITDSTIQSVTVKVNGSTIIANSGIYTISNIIENKQITVSVTKDTSYTVSVTNPPRGAKFVLSSTTGNIGQDFNFVVNVNNGCDFTNILINSTYGTITKLSVTDLGDGTSNVNFKLNYTATTGFSKKADLSIANVYYEFKFVIDYSTVGGSSILNDMSGIYNYRWNINDVMKDTEYSLDEFEMYAKYGANVKKIGETFQIIQESLEAEGCAERLSGEYTIDGETFMMVSEDVVTVNWQMVADLAESYAVVATKY